LIFASSIASVTGRSPLSTSRIVTNQLIGSAQSAAYDLLARVARDNGIEYERVASHFIQYSIVQRQALYLIRGAYTLLGEADNLDAVFTQPPSDFLNKLRHESVAFLSATDSYITGGSPPYDPAPAALGDAIVQRLEGVPSQATTFSLSIHDATPLTPLLTPPAGSSVAPISLPDAVMDATTSYYATGVKPLTAGIGPCLASPPSDGFAYVAPTGGPGGGFKIGSSCTLHLERHLLRNPPTQLAADWTVNRRRQSVAVGSATLRNAATLKDETAADALAVAGDRAGRASGFSEFSLVPDAVDPSLVTLVIDLPGQPATPIGAGTAHALVAVPGGAGVSFTREPFGPQYPDRYALRTGNNLYLSVASDGFAELSATKTWFELRPTLDGHTELDYGAGILYVNHQYQQYYWGESPDDVWGNGPNLAVGPDAIAQWSVPADGPRPPPPTPLTIFPACLDASGQPHDDGASGSQCTRFGFRYVVYVAKLTNDDSFTRPLRLTLGARADYFSPGTYTVQGGLHCYAASINHTFDNQLPLFSNPVTSAEKTAVFESWVPANSSISIWCQAATGAAAPVNMITNFTIQPCKGAAGGTCMVYP
jgi:hypothetical protein